MQTEIKANSRKDCRGDEMNDRLAEIVTIVCIGITLFAVLALLVTNSELSKAQNIYCFRKYQNDVLNYQSCMNTQFVKVLQENKDE